MTKMKYTAQLVIKTAPTMTKAEKLAVAAWLYKQGDALIKDGHLYCKHMTAKYLA